MLSSPMSKFSARFVFWSLVGLIFTNIAVGQETPATPEAPKVPSSQEQPSPAASESTPSQTVKAEEEVNRSGKILSKAAIASTAGQQAAGQQVEANPVGAMSNSGLPPKFVADGAPVTLTNIGLTVTPPQGWEVITGDPTLSMIMQVPKEKKVVYDKPIYQRNITVAKVASPSPIDESRAKDLRKELTDSFGKQGGVKDFQILEHKFFDYKAKQDGLLVYSAFNLGEFQLMQMHVLISDAQRQFLFTYTDLANRFQDQTLFGEAWKAIASAEVVGMPPSRWTKLTVIGSVILALILSLLTLVYLRNRRAGRMYANDADEVYRDDAPANTAKAEDSWESDLSQDNDFAVTQTGVWQLNSAKTESESGDWPAEVDQSHAPQQATAQVQSVHKDAPDGWNTHHNGEDDSGEGLSFVTNFR